jgi:uncharacterized membrane protein YcaP (DUF421 family)
MDAVLRAFCLYLIILVLFRITGRRTLSETTPFDFVLLLIISEATQQALIGEDNSVTSAVLVIVTLLGIDVLLSLLKRRHGILDKVLDGVPTVLVVDGKPIEHILHKSRVDIDDILEEARSSQGLERMDQIKYAVLETSGGISIIPKSEEATAQTGNQ